MTQDEHESERNDPGRNNKRTVGETGVILKSPLYPKFHIQVPDARIFLLQASTQTIKRKRLMSRRRQTANIPNPTYSNRQDPQRMAAADIRYEMHQRENRRNCQDKPLSQ